MNSVINKRIVSAAGLQVLLAIALLLSGCSKNSSNPTGTQGALSEPSIKPEVIFTLPADNAVGPFAVFNRGDGAELPSFVVQFNKLMSTYSVKPGVVSCTGFNQPVAIVIHSASNSIIYRNSPNGRDNTSSDNRHSRNPVKKTSDYDAVLQFDVVDSVYNQMRIPYEIGQKYTVTIDTSLTDINGNHLRAPYTFSFTPEPDFRVIGATPSDNQQNVPILNSGILELIFNSALQSSSLSMIKVTPPLTGRWEYYLEDSTRAYLSPTDTMSYNTTYTMEVPATASDDRGHLLGSGFSTSFTTVAFRLVSSNPPDGTGNFDAQSQLFFTFSGPLDPTTPTASFTISPHVEGSVIYPDYNSASFSFIPTGGFAYDTKYTVTISTGLKASNGTPLSAPSKISFTTEPFQVASALPADGALNVPVGQTIYFYLDGPIDTSTIRSAFSISPPVNGYFRVAGLSAFTFNPEPSYALGTAYKVTLSTALKASNGTHLGSDYSFSFTTEPFIVTSTFPSNGEKNLPTTPLPVSVSFNSQYDTASVKSAFSMSPNIPGQFRFTNYPGAASFSYTPDDSYKLGTTYTIDISTAAKALVGGHLFSPYSFSFSTIPFQVTITPADTAMNVSRGTDVTVYCNAPYDTSTVRAAFSISPSVEGSLNMNGATSNEPYFTFVPATDQSFAANTEYTVTVSTALKAADGTPLPQKYTSTFRTGQ